MKPLPAKAISSPSWKNSTALTTPIIVPALTSEATALGAIGGNDEATKIEQRIQSLQATAVNQN